MAKAVSSEAYLEACNAAHEVHAGQGSLTEYGLVAHTQMSRTLFPISAIRAGTSAAWPTR